MSVDENLFSSPGDDDKVFTLVWTYRRTWNFLLIDIRSSNYSQLIICTPEAVARAPYEGKTPVYNVNAHVRIEVSWDAREGW